MLLLSDRLALYCSVAVETSDDAILAGGSYYLTWTPYVGGVPAGVPVAAQTTTTALAAGSASWSVQFGTASAVALFATPTGEAVRGRWHLIDVTDADDPREIGSAEASLYWSPEPDGYIPATISRAATQAYVDAAVAAAGGGKPATAKTTPIDADGLTLWDSLDGWAGKFLSWANLKTALGTVFAAITHASRHGSAGADPVTPAAIGAATATQGGKADSALQPAGDGSQLTGITPAQVGAIALALGTTAGDGIRYSASGVPARSPCAAALPSAGAGVWAPALTAGAHHTVTRTGEWTNITPSGLEVGEGCSGVISGAYAVSGSAGVSADATDDLADIAASSVGWIIWREAAGYRMVCWERA